MRIVIEEAGETVLDQQKIEYHQLEVGYSFPPTTHLTGLSTLAAYLKAVGETSNLYQGTGLVPPLAVAAFAMAALAEGISLPAGAIQVSQELEFLSLVRLGDTLTSRAKVRKKQDRGRLHLLTIGLTVLNQRQEPVLTGETSFILPAPGEGGGS